MNTNEQIRQIIYDAIATVNEMLPRGRRLDPSPDTVIVGESGKLDSLELVNFIVPLEEGIERKFHEHITVVDILTEQDVWTVAAMAESLAAQVDAVAAEG